MQIEIFIKSSLDCVNKGECVAPDVCSCPEGFTGARCQQGERTLLLLLLLLLLLALLLLLLLMMLEL